MRWPVPAALVTLAVIAAGCGSSRLSPTSPATESDAASRLGGGTPPDLTPFTAGGAFYPLTSGNRWHYQQRFTARTLDARGDPIGEDEVRSQIETIQTCIETIGSHDYLIERSTWTAPLVVTLVQWVRTRQDASGLYEADVDVAQVPPCEDPIRGAITSRAEGAAPDRAAFERSAAAIRDPATRAAFDRAWARLSERLAAERSVIPMPGGGWHPQGPPGPPEGEVFRLRYPLFPGQTWAIRNSPRVIARVTGAEWLQLAPGRFSALRIRYQWDAAPRDRILVWYGRQGFLRMTLRSMATAVDDQGNSVGTVVFEEERVLDDLQLVEVTALATGR